MKKLSPAHLSDNELYSRLQKHGISGGPITATTRTVLERKLNEIQHDAELKNYTIGDTMVDFNIERKSDTNNISEYRTTSYVHSYGQNSSINPENNQDINNSSLYYGVSLLSGTVCSGEEPPFVFTDKKDALKIIKKYKGSRFKAFSSKEEAMHFASRPFDEMSSPSLVPSPISILEKQILNGLMTEKSSLFKAPKSQEMAKLKKAIESGDAEYFKNTVWSNPRYLVSNGDTPTIFKEGFRYNAMHIAACNKQAAICQLILTTIEDSKFMYLLYPDDNETIRDQRINFMLDLYLNMPEKRLCETPLHFASKFGCLKTVEVLLAHPLCDKHRENKDKKKPKDIICERYPEANIEYKKQIESLFEERFYVPVLRSDDNSLQPIIGKPLSPDCSQLNVQDESLENIYKPSMSIKALAGPMTPHQANVFYKKWKTPPRSSAKDLYKIRLGDTQKGLEVIGRELAKESRVSWKEFWPFLDCWCDLTSPDGLMKLENHLKTKHSNTSSQEDDIEERSGELSSSNEISSEANVSRIKSHDALNESEVLKCPVSDCTSPLSHLCHLLEEISLSRNPSGITTNRSSSYQKTQQKPKGKNHLSDVSTTLQFEDSCENKLFQSSCEQLETCAKNTIIETNCNFEIRALNGSMSTCADTSLSLLAENFSKNFIDAILKENSPQRTLINKDSLDSYLPHIKYFYKTMSNDNSDSSLSMIHSVIAKEIVTNLQHNLVFQEMEQIRRYLKNYVSNIYDLSSSEDECQDCYRNCNYENQRKKTVYKQHLNCIFQFMYSYTSETSDAWKEVQSCCCKWMINLNRDLNTDCTFYMLGEKLANNNDRMGNKPVSQLNENNLMDDSSDEEFYTPPSSVPSNSPEGIATPEGLVIFIEGKYPSKVDLDAVRALGNIKIDPILYPHIFQWKSLISSFSSETVESLCSPAHKRKLLKQDRFLYNNSFITPIAKSSDCTRASTWKPRNLYETSLSWEESSSE